MRTWAVLGAAAILGSAVVLIRRTGAPLVPPPPAAGSVLPRDPVVEPPAPAPLPPPPEVRKLRKDPLIDAWYRSVLRKDARGVLEAQSALIAREDETRRDLEKIAVEDPEPRLRAFSTAVLGRMKRPPPAAFFAERLSDPDPGPRISALAALERVGSAADLPAIESCTAPEEVRLAAAKAAAKIRSK